MWLYNKDDDVDGDLAVCWLKKMMTWILSCNITGDMASIAGRKDVDIELEVWG